MPDKFACEHWKNADSCAPGFAMPRVQCNSLPSAAQQFLLCRAGMLFLNIGGGILFRRFAHLTTLERRGWCCVRLTLLSAGCLSSYLFFTRSWRLLLPSRMSGPRESFVPFFIPLHLN